MPTNLDVVRGFYEAVNDGDLDRALSSLAPEIEVHTRVETYRGIDAVSQMLDERLVEWDSTVDIHEILEPVPNTVVVSHHLVMRGLHTRLTVSNDLVDVIQLRDGLMRRTEVYASLEEALASVSVP
jgi:ketosteroid isomerase-like protein